MIKNYFTLIVAITFSVLITAIDVSAQTQVKIRLATLAPRNTTFHKEIANMGEKWKKISNNKVSFTFYTDGQMGSESDMVRRMRANQIQAAMLTVGGLQSIVEDVGALQNNLVIVKPFILGYHGHGHAGKDHRGLTARPVCIIQCACAKIIPGTTQTKYNKLRPDSMSIGRHWQVLYCAEIHFIHLALLNLLRRRRSGRKSCDAAQQRI